MCCSLVCFLLLHRNKKTKRFDDSTVHSELCIVDSHNELSFSLIVFISVLFVGDFLDSLGAVCGGWDSYWGWDGYLRFAGDETDVGVETTIKWHRNHAYKTKSSLSKMNLESIKNQPRTCLKKEQKRGHQPRKSSVILGDISSRLYGFSLCALNVTPT